MALAVNHLVPRSAILLAVLVAVAACAPAPAPPAPPDAGRSSTEAQQRTPRGTLRIGYAAEPQTLSSKFLTGGGAGEFAWIFNSTLVFFDLDGQPRPLIASQIPTRDNGDWVVNADGTMRTTYRLRPNARWHDGAPLTARDFVFAWQVYLDPDQPAVSRDPESLMSSVEATDDQTLVISWKQPYRLANTLGYQKLNPLPRHLLEEKLAANRTNFAVGEEWNKAYVGSGPFRVQSWEPGSRLIAHAHSEWLLGPPGVETVEIRFIAEPSVLLANLFAGELDIVTSPAIGAEAVSAARDQWLPRGEGTLKTWETRMSFLDFQRREVPGWQRAVNDLRVRRALMHALDRSAVAEALTFGLGSTSDAFVLRADPAFAEVDRAIVKYPYDPARSAALLTEAGWERPDGRGVWRNAAGEPLEVDIWATEENEAVVVADPWRAIGIASTPFAIPRVRQRDNEFRNNFPGANTGSRSIFPENFTFTSDQVPKAELGWVGNNRGSLIDPEVDRLHRIWTNSLDQNERSQALVALNRRMTDQLGFGPLYYSAEVILAKTNVRGPVGNYAAQIGVTWNVHEWEITTP